MSWKKNGFSYIVWLVYTLLTGTVLLGLMSGRTGETGAGLLGAAVVLLAAGAVVFLLHRFAPRYSYDREEKHTVRNVVEAAVVVVLLAIGLVLRIKGLEDAGQTAAYFEMAEVAPGQRIPQIAHGAVYFYLQLLHTVFYFLGNKFAAGIWLQILLQLCAALLLYLSVRRLAGHIAALVMLAFFMCTPYMIQSVLLLAPEMLYLFFFSVVLFCVTAAYTAKLRVLVFCILGLAIAFLSYLDAAGLLLFLPALAGIFSDREEKPGGAKKIGAFLACFLGAAIGFAGCVIADAALSGKSADGVFSAWLTLYHPEGVRLPIEISASGSVWEAFALAGLMALGVFSFWCDKRTDRLGAHALGMCLALAASVFGVFTEDMPGNIYVFLLAAIMAGIGLEECFRERSAASGAEEHFKGQAAASGVEEHFKGQAAASGVEERLEGQAAASGAEERLEGQAAASGTEKRLEGQTAASGVSGAEEKMPQRECGMGQEEVPERKVKYIENPLPLPKRHERRVMDYSLKVEKDKQDFDVEVADDDDFDI